MTAEVAVREPYHGDKHEVLNSGPIVVARRLFRELDEAHGDTDTGGEPIRAPSRLIGMTMRPVLVLSLALWALVGCGESDGVDPVAHPDVTAADAAVRLVDDAEASLVLHISNQSFDDETVRLSVAVDGLTVVDGDFYVADQHNFVTFSLAMSPGSHEVTAKADSGATLRESFKVPADKTRYALIEYWGQDDSADLGWSFQPRPMMFG